MTEAAEQGRRELLRAGWTLSGLTLVSRCLGLVRDMLQAAVFGSSWVVGAFNLAWVVPNLFRRLLGEGALSSAFIPRFSRTLENEGREPARALFASMLGSVCLLLAIAAGAVLLVLHLLPLGWWAPLFAKEGLEGVVYGSHLRTLLTVLVPYLIPVCLLAFLGAALQCRGSYAPFAAAPAVLNVVWIGALLAGGPLLGLSLESFSLFLAVSVLLGGVVQVAVQLPALRAEGLWVRPRLVPRAPGVTEVLRDVLPVALGQAVFQVNTLLDQVIAAAFIPVEGANTWFFLANRLFQFPLALVGTSLAVASLPGMARLAAQGDRAGVRGLLDLAARVGLFLSVPAALGLLFLARPMVALFFEHGRFDAADGAETAAALACLSAGLPFVCLTQVATRVHQALGDLKSPVRLGCRLVGLNLVLNLLLVRPFGVAGLSAATSLTSALLALLLFRRVPLLGLPAGQGAGRFLGRQLLLVLGMGGVLGALHWAGPSWSAPVELAAGVAAGGGVYLCLAWLSRNPELRILLGRLH